mgnify:CR=1 FL=1
MGQHNRAINHRDTDNFPLTLLKLRARIAVLEQSDEGTKARLAVLECKLGIWAEPADNVE